jgi:hypothetical protein
MYVYIFRGVWQSMVCISDMCHVIICLFRTLVLKGMLH